MRSGRSGDVFIAIPTYTGISCETAMSLFSAKEKLRENGIDSAIEFCTENCHVDDGRNYLVRDFLESDCEQLVFIDSDVRFDGEDLVRLIQFKQDVVAGVYPLKTDEPGYPVRFFEGDIWGNADGLIKVRGVPTGFLKIRRSVLQKLYDSVPKYIPKKEIGSHSLFIPLIFERVLRGQERLGGDYEFCRKWSELGGEIFIDPHMRFGHIGQTEYSGSLSSYLYLKNGLQGQRIAEIFKKIQDGTEDARDLLSLIDMWGNHFALEASALSAIISLSRECAGTILECGSGLSTLVLAASGCPVVSLEHNPQWFEKVKGYLSDLSIDNVDLRLCPLNSDGWYSETGEGYSLVVVDGPPRAEGNRSKIVDYLHNVAPDCAFIVDDVDSGSDVTPLLSEKFGAQFISFGRFAAGRIK